MLENVFAAVLNMSVAASVAAVLIILFRWIFGNRLPKILSYALWAIVLLRLLFPFSLQSVFSIFNALPVNDTITVESMQVHETVGSLPAGVENERIPPEASGAATVMDIGGALPSPRPEAPVDPGRTFMLIASVIWLAGAAGLLSLNLFAYLRMTLRLNDAVLFKHDDLISWCGRLLKLRRRVHIYTSDKVHTPVVCGLLKARIILPLDIAQGLCEQELRHIITHELVHIKRFDYLLKPLSMLALSVHWFNPLVWLSFVLSQKDMEMSCDEKVMSVFNSDIRAEYAESLIKLAARRNIMANGGLLAFGERNIKSRIKGIMRFKKPGFLAGAAAVILLLAAGMVLLTNGQSAADGKDGKNGTNPDMPGINEKLNSNERFAIYLVKNAAYTKDAIEMGLDRIKLEDTPVITDRDMEYYNWSDHSFALSEEALSRIPRVTVSGLPFVVVVNGEKIYLGAFWTSISSVSTDLPVIDVTMASLGKAPGNPFSISEGYPGNRKASIDVRDDDRIFNALKETGKLNLELKANNTEVDKRLEEIIKNGPQISSNPFDYIKESKAFDELVAMGQPALDAMMDLFAKSNEDGLKEYIMAAACAKILGVFDDEKGIGIDSGREWFYKYGVFEKDAGLERIDADDELFQDTAEKPEIVLPAQTDMKNLEEVIANSILTVNRRYYVMGEKAVEAHKIYGTEEKDGTVNVYMLVSFRWFGFENGIFTVVAGGSGGPVRLQLKKKENGEYAVLEYKRAMDGGMWSESIREMFPEDLAETVMKDVIEKKADGELLEEQLLQARSYLEKIGREADQVMPKVPRDKTDKEASAAIYLVTLMRHDFPDWNGSRDILVRTGGKAPGMTVRCTLQTQCEKIGDEQYSIVLTKTWDIRINGVQPVSYWKYRVTGERVELLEEEDNDGSIKIIK